MTNNIKAILEKQGKSLNWLSKETGVRYQTIHDLANNKTESVKFDIIKRICEALKCSLDDLFNL